MVMAIPLSDIKVRFSWYLAYIASHPAKAKLVCLKPFTFTIHNGIYPLWQLVLDFRSSVQTLSEIAVDSTTVCSLCSSDSQELSDLPLK